MVNELWSRTISFAAVVLTAASTNSSCTRGNAFGL